MTEQQTSIPVAEQEAPTSQTQEEQKPAKASNNGVKAILDEVVKDAKIITKEVKQLPKKRKTLFYAGIGLMVSPILGYLTGSFYFYLVFGVFIPVAYGMVLVLSSYTGKDILDEIEKNKQRQQNQAKPTVGKVEMHEEDKIHETH